MLLVISPCFFFACSALGARHEQQFQSRLSQVKQEIDEKGHYDLRYEELAYGARLAWRNSPRCINRIQWRQLEVCQKLSCHCTILLCKEKHMIFLSLLLDGEIIDVICLVHSGFLVICVAQVMKCRSN